MRREERSLGFYFGILNPKSSQCPRLQEVIGASIAHLQAQIIVQFPLQREVGIILFVVVDGQISIGIV